MEMVPVRRKRASRAPVYPQTSDEWRSAIASGFGLSPAEGITKYEAGIFPFDDFLVWLEKEFSADKGYSSDFVPALVRNLKGLVAWIYGKGSEPYWPGHDNVPV